MTPEGRVLKAVSEYLALQERLGRCVFWRQNNGGVYDPSRKIFRKPQGAGQKAGIPDLVAVIAGRCVGIEVKSDVGRLSPAQSEIKALLERHGAVYIVARGVQDVEPLFVSNLISKPSTNSL